VRRTVPPSAEIEEQIDRLLSVGVGENPRESLSELARLGARLIIQRAVEDEFDAWLGRARYERRPAQSAASYTVLEHAERRDVGPRPREPSAVAAGRHCPCRSAQTVRNATVGGIRDARTAGIRPANAPIRMAEAMPPDHASTGITMAQFFELA
jgi:hypothetical protein